MLVFFKRNSNNNKLIKNKHLLKEEEPLRYMILLQLMDQVQFIYELILAKLELQGLNSTFKIKEDLRTFELYSGDMEVLRRRLAYFKHVDNRSTVYSELLKYNQTRSQNQYLVHWFYPYKGKYHPQMIRALLNYMNVQMEDTILDPFIGSGTTALEAQLLGIHTIGIDVSPLCVLQSRVKTESIFVISKILKCSQEILTQLDQLDEQQSKITLQVLEDLINNIDSEHVRNFFELAKMIAISDSKRRKKDLFQAFRKNLIRMVQSLHDYEHARTNFDLVLGNVNIFQGDARKLPLSDESIDGIITSPPYSIALDYIKNDAHALQAMGLDTEKLRENFIGVRGKGKQRVDLYNQDLKIVLSEMYRVLKPDTYAVIVIGNAHYLGKPINTVKYTIDIGKELGFQLVHNINKVIFGLYNVMQKESILIFKKSS